LQLHTYITRGLVSKEKLGRYKRKQNFVVDARGHTIYTPPSPGETKKLVQDLLRWVHSSRTIHPVIVSAIFHHQIVSIHPFSDGNGRVARAASQWILYQRNFDPYQILALDDYYARDRKTYYEKIQQARELDYDLTYWIEYVAVGAVQAFEHVYNRLTAYAHDKDAAIVITPRQEELLQLIREHEGIGSQIICRKLKINRARVHQLMVPLVNAGMVSKEGRARATRYFLKSEIGAASGKTK
jgi:Fic family protein